MDRENVISLVEDAIEIVEKEAFWTIASGLRDALALLKEQDKLLRKKQKGINKLQADYAELRHKFLEKTQIVRCHDCVWFDHYNVECEKGHDPKPPYTSFSCTDGKRKKGR